MAEDRKPRPDPVIGRAVPSPIATLQHGIYIGANRTLQHKGALLLHCGFGGWIAQFDDINTGYGYGWHNFRKADFHQVRVVGG